MSATDGTYFRPDKEDDAHTVLYEIDLLRFAKGRLETSSTKGDEWVYLEDFLLHYRNLIEFFGKEKYGKGDLTIFQPESIWLDRVPDKASLDSMTRPDLWEKYDTRDNEEAISKYLHHCTTQRTEEKAWDVTTMYEELRPIIENFESLLPEYKPATGLISGRVVGQTTLDGISTASTRTIELGLNPEK